MARSTEEVDCETEILLQSFVPLKQGYLHINNSKGRDCPQADGWVYNLPAKVFSFDWSNYLGKEAAVNISNQYFTKAGGWVHQPGTGDLVGDQQHLYNILFKYSLLNISWVSVLITTKWCSHITDIQCLLYELICLSLPDKWHCFSVFIIK